jgi:hypothetical protein
MSIAATHPRHHIHLPWMSIIAVLVAAAVAAAVLVLVNQPTTVSTIAESTAVPVPAVGALPVPAVGAAPVPMPESPALRSQLAQEVATAVPQEAQFAYPRNHVVGVTLSPTTSVAAFGGQLGAPVAPGDPFPHNHFPSEP